MSKVVISDAVKYVGCDDKTIELFENQYKLPNGVSYNSYVILDEKTAVMDTADQRVSDEWISNVKEALAGRNADYLVISHLEPDHSANIQRIAELYPEMKLVCSAKAAAMLPQFFDCDFSGRVITVKEGETLSLGSHTLKFIMAPMVHWPEVMVEYEETEKILFSADGFGKFGTLDVDADWDCEARRYYFNIVGKYGAPVQTLLKKASALDIKTICPLHGPVLSGDLSHYLERYNTWSSYEPEESGVFIAYASIHGNTAKAALMLADMIKAKGVKVVASDLTKCGGDLSEAVEDAFRYDRMIVAASTYDAGVFPVMAEFIAHLKSKAYQKRRVGIMENGSWAPAAARLMRAKLENLKDLHLCETEVSLRGALNQTSEAQMDAMAVELCAE